MQTKHINHREYPKSLRTKTNESLHFILKDAKEAAALGNENAGYYQDEICYVLQELNRRKDKPVILAQINGAKVIFSRAEDEENINETIALFKTIGKTVLALYQDKPIKDLQKISDKRLHALVDEVKKAGHDVVEYVLAGV